MTNPDRPYATSRIPVAHGLQGLLALMAVNPEFAVCPYVAGKTDQQWEHSTSRVYLNQVLDRLIYVPVSIAADDLSGLSELARWARQEPRVVAINITHPHKNHPAWRQALADPTTPVSEIDTLIRDASGWLRPYSLNAAAFLGWYHTQMGSFAGANVVLVGVGGVGEPLARLVARQEPAELVLVDPQDKSALARELGACWLPSVREVPALLSAGHSLVVLNASGKDGGSDDTGLAHLLATHHQAVPRTFVDLRPQLQVPLVDHAAAHGWSAWTGHGMNAHNDYELLTAMAACLGQQPPSFAQFQALVAAAS